MYDFSRPWLTHCSIQCQLAGNIGADVAHWRGVYHKPIVLDEMTYEGDIGGSYGNISGQELLRRFWEVACQGGYGGHGKSYFLFYYGLRQPKIMEFDLRHFGVAPDTRYAVELIDTWNMTVTDAGVHCGRFRLPMPGKEYMAVRLRRIE